MGIFSKLFKNPTNKEQALSEDLANKLPKMLEGAVAIIKRDVTENDENKGVNIKFNIPGRFAKEWFFSVIRSGMDPSKYVLKIGAQFPDDDRYERSMSDYVMYVQIFTGTKQEIIDYLATPECREKIVSSVANIDKSVKNHD